MSHPTLAAIRFDDADVDSLLEQTVKTLVSQGHTVRGALQTRGETGGECHCADMDLHVIGQDRVFRISQPLGNGSRGCRLHPGALADCAAFLQAELDDNVDLLVLNRFGRGESEGRGFRDLIASALSKGIPVLTALRPTYCESWAAFGGELARDLPMTQSAVLEWFADTRTLCHAA
ncbi:DUF2478 domain-containing protein [Pacificoceanicola onchidii]|uniref:DUF2478 domain-containing protein n=1 Tax=Pacificoceanicola onchidii TaxID=2562685 RepID=UPI0010A47118|nr:DUF2478 domain-containing protein [Pacificoceanicola onchidii]